MWSEIYNIYFIAFFFVYVAFLAHKSYQHVLFFSWLCCKNLDHDHMLTSVCFVQHLWISFYLYYCQFFKIHTFINLQTFVDLKKMCIMILFLNASLFDFNDHCFRIFMFLDLLVCISFIWMIWVTLIFILDFELRVHLHKSWRELDLVVLKLLS